MTNAAAVKTIRDALTLRFGEDFKIDETLPNLDELARMASRRVIRRYLDRPVDPALLRLLCACALSAPTKSDLQQADIIIVNDAAKRKVIADLIPDQPFIRTAPAFLIFLANGRRLPEISKNRGKPFPNDHLDLFFNATVDAAIEAVFRMVADAAGQSAGQKLTEEGEAEALMAAEGHQRGIAAARCHDGDFDLGKLFLKTGIGDRIANFRKAIENDLPLLLRCLNRSIPFFLPRRSTFSR